MFSTTNTLERELFVPVAPAQAYSALRDVAAQMYSLKSEDDFTMALVFTSSVSAFTYGETISAQVVPVEGGSTIKISISPKVGGQLGQGNKNQKIADGLFGEVTRILKAARGG
jgi:hypothetical protein